MSHVIGGIDGALLHLMDRVSLLEKQISALEPKPVSMEKTQEKSPGDLLAERVQLEVGLADELGWRGDSYARLRSASDHYRAIKNAHPTTDQLFGSPLDPVKVARLLLDSLTSGALSSLICTLRDDWLNVNFGSPDVRQSIEQSLRSLGEKL